MTQRVWGVNCCEVNHIPHLPHLNVLVFVHVVRHIECFITGEDLLCGGVWILIEMHISIYLSLTRLGGRGMRGSHNKRARNLLLTVLQLTLGLKGLPRKSK